MAELYVSKPTPSIELPGNATAPFGLASLNAPGSNFASTYGYSTSKLIADEILYRIIDTAPEQYNALKVLFSKSPEGHGSDEVIWFEHPWGRPLIEANAWNHNTGVITLTGTYNTVQELPAVKGDVIKTVGETPLLVTAQTLAAGIADSSTLTVISQTGGSLTAGLISSGDYLALQGPIIADGMNDFYHYDRINPDEKYNYIQRFQRNIRFSTWELAKYKSKGLTDFLEFNKKESLRQLRTDMFSFAMNGTRGEFLIPGSVSGNYSAKCTEGYFQTMSRAGSLNATVSLSGLPTAFEYLAHASNYKREGGTRFVYATDANLFQLSKAYKDEKTRYTPESKLADLNLEQIVLGTARFVLVPCELFKEESVFPTTWADRFLVIDQEMVTPIIFNQFPMMDGGETINKQRGSREDFTDWWIQAQLGVKFANPLGSFYIDIA